MDLVDNAEFAIIREIAFDDNEDDLPTRAWPDLLPNKRILIYCL